MTHEQSIYLLLSPKSQEYEDEISLRTVNITYTHVHVHIHTHTHRDYCICFEVKHLKALFPTFMSHHSSSM